MPEHGSIEIARLAPADRDPWERLWKGYMEFYDRVIAPEAYERAWRLFGEDATIHALGAKIDGTLVGIVHFLIHPSTSNRDVCYLQDLFTDPEARGRGVARALIHAVAKFARERDCWRVYWHTHKTNETARRLYDRVGQNRGFVRYDIDV